MLKYLKSKKRKKNIKVVERDKKEGQVGKSHLLYVCVLEEFTVASEGCRNI